MEVKWTMILNVHGNKKPRIEVKLYSGVNSTPLQLFSELFDSLQDQ